MKRKPRIYIETSVVSYLTARTSRDLILSANQATTQAWWAERRLFEPIVSDLVVFEAAKGDALAAKLRLETLAELPLLAFSEAARELSLALIHGLALPAKAVDDAYHVAIAAVHGLDFLASWNCTHIVNPVTRSRIEKICRQCGYEPALIATPQELFAIIDMNLDFDRD